MRKTSRFNISIISVLPQGGGMCTHVPPLVLRDRGVKGKHKGKEMSRERGDQGHIKEVVQRAHIFLCPWGGGLAPVWVQATALGTLPFSLSWSHDSAPYSAGLGPEIELIKPNHKLIQNDY